MIVNENGVPNDLEVVGSNAFVSNQNVLAAVSQYRFTPGTLPNQPTAVPANLEITVRTTRSPRVLTEILEQYKKGTLARKCPFSFVSYPRLPLTRCAASPLRRKIAQET